MTDIVILGGARTAIGTFGGSLAGVSPIDLGAIAAKAALTRAEVAAEQIGHVAFGHVINTEPRDMYLSRVAALEGVSCTNYAAVSAADPMKVTASSSPPLNFPPMQKRD